MVEITLFDWFGQMPSNFVRSQIQVVIPLMNKVVLVWNELQHARLGARSFLEALMNNAPVKLFCAVFKLLILCLH